MVLAMMVAVIEIMKKMMTKQTCILVDGLKTDLDKVNISGDTYHDTIVFEEVKRAHKMMYTKLSSNTINVNSRVVYNNPAFQDFVQIEYVESLGKRIMWIEIILYKRITEKVSREDE